MVEQDSSKVQVYWDTDPEAKLRQCSTTWTANPIIEAEVYRRASGYQTSAHWTSWVMHDFFQGRKFESMLSSGCGPGDHELIFARHGFAKEIDAFDLSSTCLELARTKAAKEGLNINFYQDNFNTFEIAEQKQYDVILCAGSLHHVKEIERFLETVRLHLKQDGYFVVCEYIGDAYNIYSSKQKDIIQRLYRCFPQQLRSGMHDEFENLTIEQVMGADPSESVRSKLILPFLNFYFDFEVFHPMGGAILHPLYPLLNSQFFASDNQSAEAILKLLLEFESILMEVPGGLGPDFCLSILRQKGQAANRIEAPTVFSDARPPIFQSVPRSRAFPQSEATSSPAMFQSLLGKAKRFRNKISRLIKKP